MILTLDNLATKYHCLPSEALATATTFDLYVLDVATRWSNYQYEQSSTGTKSAPKLSQDQMLDMVARAKARSAE
jgi:hypothetical protein